MTIDIDTAVESNANTLFQSHSLHEITDLSKSLTTKAQRKHEELRTLVASQYRDLLQTADQIIEMDKLSKQSDQELYKLSFLNTSKLNKNLSIERNITKFWHSEPVELENRVVKVKKNAELFLVMSQLLNLSSVDPYDVIIGVLKRLPLEEGWFQDRKPVVDNKVEELQMVMLDKVSAMSLDELLKVDIFVQQTQWFEKTVIENAIYESLLNKLTLENLSLVLEKFAKFKPKLQDHYSRSTESILQDLKGLMATVDDKGTKLDLYTMELDDDYLTKIQYLSHGLIYDKYQRISTDLSRCLTTLNYVQVIDDALFKKYKKELQDVIDVFITHAEKSNNTALVKYLRSL
jgi:hypothetical protein